MAFLNRCIWAATSTGLGSFVVSAAAQNGYTPAQCLTPAVVNGEAYHYFAVNGTEHEEGDGVYSTGTATLTRATIRNSSTGAKVNFTAAPVVTMGGAIASDNNADYPSYYISNTGNDSADGLTPATAWQTITKVNASTFAPGSSIFFNGGQTFTGAVVAPSAGTSSNPIIFSSYGSGRATISSSTSNGFTSTNKAGIIVRDLIFTGTASSNSGIKFDNNLAGNVHLQNIQVRNCTVSNYGFHGIHVTGSNGISGYDNVIIDSCTVTGCTSVAVGANVTGGITVCSSVATNGLAATGASFFNVMIQNCEANNNLGCNNSPDVSGYGIFIASTDGGYIFGCTVDGNGTNATNTISAGPCGIIVSDARDITVNACTARNTGSANHIDGDGIDIDFGCVNCTIRECYTKGNSGPGYYLYAFNDALTLTSNNNSLLYSISDNDGTDASNAQRCGIAINAATAATVTNLKVIGNTVYQSQASTSAIMIPNSGGSAAIQALVASNTFIVTASITLVNTAINPSSIVFSGNSYRHAGGITGSTFAIVWNGVTYASVAHWSTATGQEVGGGAGDFNRVTASYVSVFGPTIDACSFDLDNTAWQPGPVANNGKKFKISAGGAYNGFNDYWVYNATAADNCGVFGWIYNGGLPKWAYHTSTVVGWDSGIFASGYGIDSGLARVAPGVVEINNGTKNNLADLRVRNITHQGGSATVAPLNFLAGTNLTTAVAGAIEYDGTVYYASPANSSRAVHPAVYFIRQHAAYTLANSAAAQKLFNASANGAVTLPLGAYYFECMVALSGMSATTGNGLFSLVSGTGAATNFLTYFTAIDAAAGAIGAWSSGAMATNVTPSPMATTQVATAMQFVVKGTFEVTTAGTFIPSFTLATAVATAVVAIGSYFQCYSVGAATATSVGNWS